MRKQNFEEPFSLSNRLTHLQNLVYDVTILELEYTEIVQIGM